MFSRSDDGRPDSTLSPPRAAPSLFERLASVEAGAARRGADADAAIASIIRNLRISLNSHAGGVPARPDWGLPDFHDFAIRMDDVAPHLADAIRCQIEAFEPRLRRVVVRHRPERELFMVASFDIQAELVGAERASAVVLETRIDPSGAVLVS